MKELVNKMTIADKVACTSGKNRWQTHNFPSLGIPSIFVADGPHGLRIERELDTPTDTVALKSICYPSACSLASSWDVSLLSLLGKTLAEECREAGVDVLLGPGVNIKRSPLCGRNFEYFSEDPILAGILGSAYIDGLQKEGIGACVKHYACNNQETERFTISAEVDERTLHELYLRPFEIIVRKSRPWSLMCSYNRLNGIQVAENAYLLNKVLRERWGFDGVVISDWAAVNDKGRSLAAGVDLQMPGPCHPFDKDVLRAIDTGLLSEKTVDISVERLLSLTGKCISEKSGSVVFNRQDHHSAARQIASQCVVLLKNQGLLPLNEKIGKLAVIGHMARAPRYQGGGSSHVNSFEVESPLDELAKTFPETEILYASGCDADGNATSEDLAAAASLASLCDAAIIFIGLPESYETEGRDRRHMKLPEGHQALAKAVSSAQSDCVAIVLSGSVVELDEVSECFPAILYGGLLGEGVGGAIADVLSGRINPSGKLAETFPLRLEDTPSYHNFPGTDDKVLYGERLYVGYRWYDKKKMEVQYPFGHGLSYTTFSYRNLSVSSSRLHSGQEIELTFQLENTGRFEGKEAVQLYLSGCESYPERPLAELKDFCKVSLCPGEIKTVSFILDSHMFSAYSPDSEGWYCPEGKFEILIGASSRDIRLRTSINMEPDGCINPEICRNTQIGQILQLSDDKRRFFVERIKTLLDRGRVEESELEKLLDFYRERSVVKLLYWAGPDVKMEDLDSIISDLNRM